jgi:hypothetical protein
MADLKKKRPVAEPIAAFDAFGTTDTQGFINAVLIIRVVDVGPLDRRRWAQTILSPGIEAVRFRFEISSAQLTVTAESVGVNAFDGRLFQDTVGGTVSAAHAFLRIDLPHRSIGRTVPHQSPHESPQTRDSDKPCAVAQKLAPSDG